MHAWTSGSDHIDPTIGIGYSILGEMFLARQHSRLQTFDADVGRNDKIYVGEKICDLDSMSLGERVRVDLDRYNFRDFRDTHATLVSVGWKAHVYELLCAASSQRAACLFQMERHDQLFRPRYINTICQVGELMCPAATQPSCQASKLPAGAPAAGRL